MPSSATRSFFQKMSEQGLKLTYDDVRLGTKYSEILPIGAKIETMFSRRIKLNIPIVSSPMDTVTSAPMAIAMAEAGGLGIIHRGMSPEAQAKEVARVKHRLHGRIETPITVRDDETVEAVLNMCQRKQYSFSSFPVIDSEGRLVGLVTGNDFEFCLNPQQTMRDIMTPISKLITSAENTGKDAAWNLLLEHKKKILLLVKETGLNLLGMYAFYDLKRIFTGNKAANVDTNGQLVVGAAIGVGEEAIRRADLLAEEGCNLFHIDTAHGDSRDVLRTLRDMKHRFSEIDVAAGNVSNGKSAKHLVEEGVDLVLCGQGPGSICTTRVVAGVGVPQVSAVFDCVEALEGTGVPVCADGGITNSGDMVIALAVGASSVMLGGMLAGHDEAPGEKVEIRKGVWVKKIRGMGSLEAMQENAASRAKYGQAGVSPTKVVPEGVVGIVPYRGAVQDTLAQCAGGIRAGLAYHGAHNLEELVENAEIFRMTGAGLAESHPHDITITAEAPNYKGRP